MNIKLTGLNELLKAVDPSGKERRIKDAVRVSGQMLEMKMKQKAVFNRGYSTGATQQSIQSVNSGFSVKVGPTTAYAGYLEYGTRFMSPQPFIKPALDAVRPLFEKKLEQILRS